MRDRSLPMSSLRNIAIPLAREELSGLVSNLTSNAVNKFERKISEKGAVRAGKRFTLFILNEHMNAMKIITSLEDSGVLIDGVTETVKHEIKNKKTISWCFFSRSSHFISATSNFFSSKRYNWKRS